MGRALPKFSILPVRGGGGQYILLSTMHHDDGTSAVSEERSKGPVHAEYGGDGGGCVGGLQIGDGGANATTCG
jgi:hypothetical protein